MASFSSPFQIAREAIRALRFTQKNAKTLWKVSLPAWQARADSAGDVAPGTQ
jgi:hypothetical protein